MSDPNRIAPYSEAAERAVIGTAILSSRECLPELSDIRTDDFLNTSHREVWDAIRALEARGSLVDAISVQDEVRARGACARLPEREAFVLALAMDATAPEAAIAHAKTVKKMATLRGMIALCTEVASRAYGLGESESVLADMRAGLERLEVSGAEGQAQRICDIMDAVTAEMQARAGRKPSEHLANTGISAVDEIIGHFRRGHVVTIGGLPGMGKSAFARQVLRHNVMNGLPGIIFSNEMDRGEWTEALISLCSHVPATNLARGTVSLQDWTSKVMKHSKNICGYPLWVDDRVMTAGQTTGEARRWFSKHVRTGMGRDYGLIVVDYLNLIPPDEKAENRNREVARIFAQFKRLAKDLRTTVFMVAQLNRKSSTENREPLMHDFRDCGEIESQSDVIICPWREGYNKSKEERPVPFVPAPARILILKQKGGAYGGVDVEWHRERMEFTDTQSFQPQEQPNWQDGRSDG